MNIEKLKRMAAPLVKWGADSAWGNPDGTATVGYIDEDDNHDPIATVDVTIYDGFEDESLGIAQFIAAANPAAIQSLLAYVDRLEAQRDRLLNACKASITVMDLLRTTGDDAKSWYAQDRNGAMVKVSDVIKSCKEAITEAESQT